MFTADKIGERPMRIAMQREEAKVWFGAAPPDLTVIARSRASGVRQRCRLALYTYLRGFYRDRASDRLEQRVFENVGMPHVPLASCRASRSKFVERPTTVHGGKVKTISPRAGKPGKMSKRASTTRPPPTSSPYLVWMGEPMAETRKTIGTVVLAFLGSSSFPIFSRKILERHPLIGLDADAGL